MNRSLKFLEKNINLFYLSKTSRKKCISKFECQIFFETEHLNNKVSYIIT